jgi:hypothetical protein
MTRDHSSFYYCLTMVIVSVSLNTANAKHSVTICTDTIGQQNEQLYYIPGIGYINGKSQAIKHYSDILDEIKDKLEGCFNQDEDVDFGEVEYCIDTWNTERYGFSYRYNRVDGRKQIFFGFQSLVILGNIATTIAISENLNVQNHFRWWMSYALYLRRTNDWSKIADPLTILGKNDPEYNKLILTDSKFYFREMLSFIIAHEISHVLFKHGESFTSQTMSSFERNLQIRRWEEEADRNALEILSRRIAYDKGLGPSGASLVFLNFHLIDGWYGNNNATHPADTKRMQSLSNFVLNDLDHSMWPSSEWEEMRTRSESFGKNAILAEDPSYFDGFNKAASEIRLDMLQFEKFK